MSDIVQPSSVNPYASIGSIYTDGLDNVVQAFSGTLTLDQLIANVPAYLQSTFYPSGDPPKDQQIQLSAIVGNTFNAYAGPKNPIWTSYSMGQSQIINEIIAGLKKLSINKNSAHNFFQLTDESIATSCLSSMEQAPLYMATAICEAAYDYLYGEIEGPDEYWSLYFDDTAAVNYYNLNNWIVATFRGALIGTQQSVGVVPTNAPQGTGIAFNFVTTVGGALTTTFGEIVYNWVPRPQIQLPKIIFSQDIIHSGGNLSDNYNTTVLSGDKVNSRDENHGDGRTEIDGKVYINQGDSRWKSTQLILGGGIRA